MIRESVDVFEFFRRGLERGWRRSRRLLGFQHPPWTPKDYATHLPVLLGLGRIFPLRSVLELGCGYFSTLTFLDRSLFPELEVLHSLESDPAWMEKVQSRAGSDPRLRMTVTHDPMDDALRELSPDRYDLILVDNSTEAASRAATVRAVAAWCAGHTLVAIHDFETEQYQQAARAFPHRFEFWALIPSTGLAWKSRAVDRQRLRRLHATIRRHSQHLSPEDTAGWVAALDATPHLARKTDGTIQVSMVTGHR